MIPLFPRSGGWRIRALSQARHPCRLTGLRWAPSAAQRTATCSPPHSRHRRETFRGRTGPKGSPSRASYPKPKTKSAADSWMFQQRVYARPRSSVRIPIIWSRWGFPSAPTCLSPARTQRCALSEEDGIKKRRCFTHRCKSLLVKAVCTQKSQV